MCSGAAYIPSVSAGAFDYDGLGARPRGMGDAFVALADDANAVVWNPAGLGRIHSPELTFMHRDLYSLGLVTRDFLSYVHPQVVRGSIGISWNRLGTTRSVSFLNYSEHVFNLAYGISPFKTLCLGSAFKYYQVDYEISASGWGVDLGLIYQLYQGHINLGLMWQNINRPGLYWDNNTRETLPSNLRAGIAVRPNPSLNMMVDVDKLLESPVKPHAGMELWLLNRRCALRAGTYSRRRNVWDITGGAGIRFSSFQLDYAWDSHWDLGGTHHVSLSVLFR